MKRTLCFILLLSVLSVITAYAHPGSLDDKGGHIDSSTGKYHYHHGYPAHQHTNGQCPYDFDDQTNRDSTPSHSVSYTRSNTQTEKTKHFGDYFSNIINNPIFAVPFFLLYLISAWFFSKFKENKILTLLLSFPVVTPLGISYFSAVFGTMQFLRISANELTIAIFASLFGWIYYFILTRIFK